MCCITADWADIVIDLKALHTHTLAGLLTFALWEMTQEALKCLMWQEGENCGEEEYRLKLLSHFAHGLLLSFVLWFILLHPDFLSLNKTKIQQ